MNVGRIIQVLGGHGKVASLTGLSASQISQMKARRRMADHHLRFFIALRPELDWFDLLEEDYGRFTTLINEKSLRRLRATRRYQLTHL